MFTLTYSSAIHFRGDPASHATNISDKAAVFDGALSHQSSRRASQKKASTGIKSWVTDESFGLIAEGSRLVCKSGEGGTPRNAYYRDAEEGYADGEHYWHVTFHKLEGFVFAGLTTHQLFGRGWAGKGAFYGGNLSDGSALLVSGFGPRLTSGDVLGIFVDATGETNVNIYFDINSKSLGLGFTLGRTCIVPFFPSVQLDGFAEVTINKVDGKPESITRARGSPKGTLDGAFEMLQDTFENGNRHVGISRAHVTLVLSLLMPEDSDDIAYRVQLQVINSVVFKMRWDAENKEYKTSSRMSTLMAGPDDLMKLESEVNELLTDPMVMEVKIGPDNVRTLTVANGRGLTARFKEIRSDPKPYVGAIVAHEPTQRLN